MYATDETIAAIASGTAAARGIVRISGPDVIPILQSCFSPLPHCDITTLTSAAVVSGTIGVRQSHLRRVAADIYVWPRRRSYTRQDAAEIHLLGSPPLLSAVLKTVCIAGARLAEPGEFTLRAFLAGRLDLTQAEAVLAVIDARGPREFQGALAQMAGGLAAPLHRLREELLDLLVQLEAGLDFAEEDLEFIGRAQIADQLDGAAAVVAQLTEQLAGRAHSDQQPRVVLRGFPNVGKSSLFNVLTGHAALVSPQAGTTRDYLSSTLDLDGVQCRIVDTAGVSLHSVSESIDEFAQEQSVSQAESGDLQILCLDATRPLNIWELQQLAATPVAPRLVVATKCDLPSAVMPGSAEIGTSAHSGQGLAQLHVKLHAMLAGLQREDHAMLWTAERCSQSLRDSGAALARAAELNRTIAGDELLAAEIRGALTELGRVVGAVYTDDILDRIFSRFCIGK